MINFFKSVFKRMKCKHVSETVEYSGLCIVRFRCDKCGRDRVEERFNSRL